MKPIFSKDSKNQLMKGGQINQEFVSRDGRSVRIRSPRWEDLDLMLEFINDLVSEKLKDPGFGILSDQKQTRQSEATWLSQRLVDIETGRSVFATAFAEGKLVGQCEVSRGRANDEFHHGSLGISVSKEYRDEGIGRELMKIVLRECKRADFKTIELEAFGNNKRAIHLYESVGFKLVGIIPKKMYRVGHYYDGAVMSIIL
ncbi:MAG TPA: GNAT family protein [Nitrososphaerales archaeon]|nr:GNAT family protein [Nitrososphaerales archaeon]